MTPRSRLLANALGAALAQWVLYHWGWVDLREALCLFVVTLILCAAVVFRRPAP